MDSRDLQPADDAEVEQSLCLADLYRRYERELHWFVMGVLHDHEASGDVVQATFVKAAEATCAIPPEALKAWLFRVALNEALTWRRRSHVDRKARQEVGSTKPGSVDARPDELFIHKEDIERVRKAIGGLSPQQQRVVRLRVYDEKTFAQIAAETGAPLGTVLTHMRRALEKLRKALERGD